MMQTAVVTKIIAPGICEIRVRRNTACAEDCRECGTGCADAGAVLDALARNAAGARAGDHVLIESSTRSTLLLAALVYMVPLLLFFLGWLIHPAAGGAGLLLGVGLCFFCNRFLQKKGGVAIKIVAVLPEGWEERPPPPAGAGGR